MGQQAIRQRARRSAREMANRQRQERLAKERRVEELAVAVMAAVAERDETVAALERRAGQALVAMTTVEGLSLAEAVEWCGEQVNVREATRLRAAAEPDTGATAGTGEAADDRAVVG